MGIRLTSLCRCLLVLGGLSGSLHAAGFLESIPAYTIVSAVLLIGAAIALVVTLIQYRKAQAKLMAELLERKELERIINRSPVVVLHWGVGGDSEGDWPVEFVSDNIRAFGYSPEDLCSGRPSFAKLIHPDDRLRVAEEASRHSSQSQVETFSREYRIITADGNERWVDERVWILRDEDKNVTGYQGILVDIHSRRKAQLDLHESENRLRIFYNNAAVGVVFSDLDGRILDCNETFLKMLGRSRQDFHHLTFHEISHPDDPAIDINKIIAANDRGAPYYQVEKRYSRQDGSYFWAALCITLIPDKEGEPGQLAGTILDITRRREAQEDLERYRDHLEDIVQRRTGEIIETNERLQKEAEERKRAEVALQFWLNLQHQITAISTSFIHLTPEEIKDGIDQRISDGLDSIGNFLEVDRCSVFLLREADSLLENTHEWRGNNIDSSSTFQQLIPVATMPDWFKAIYSLKPFHIPSIPEHPLISDRDDVFIPVSSLKSMSVIPMAARGKLTGFLLFSSILSNHDRDDETMEFLQILGEVFMGALERKWTEQALIRSERMAAVGTLASGVAHEFNNINTSVLGYTELALNLLPEEHACYSYIEHILHSASRAKDLTRNLLTFSGDDQGWFQYE